MRQDEAEHLHLVDDDGDNLINRVNPNSTEDIYTYNDANQITGVQTVKVDNSTCLVRGNIFASSTGLSG
ncbi:hypothetical protein [Acididesulfobacillus acetoxydans]|uniref:hypothetical protein n=1 Tax=Acididesulfobacillus acetoxydans TaxID=1561005 RepID=UPI001F116E14|nr:hypothetical protein [Acididesulfobacillus acetoxydans]